MSYVVVCQNCSKKNAVPDDVFERRIMGRKVSLRCKGCQQAIQIDGTDPVQRARLGVPTVSGATQRPPVAPAAPMPATPPLLPALRSPRSNTASKTLLGLAAPPLIAQPQRLPDERPAVSPPAEPFQVAPPIPIAAASPKVTTTVGKQKADVTPPAVVMVSPSVPEVERPQTRPSASLPEGERPQTRQSASAAEGERPQTLSTDELVGRASTSAVGRDRRSRATSGGWYVALSAVFALSIIAAVIFAVKRDHAASATPARAPSAVERAAPAPSQSAPPVPVASAPPAPPPGDVPAAPAVAATDESEIPSTVNARTVLARTAVALRRAERCHPWGHAVGSADVFVTFAPRGRVVAARIEGEPLASAPVARCILERVQSVKIPAYKGEQFTLRQKITLR